MATSSGIDPNLFASLAAAYVGGIEKPTPGTAGFVARVNAQGTNLEYVEPGAAVALALAPLRTIRRDGSDTANISAHLPYSAKCAPFNCRGDNVDDTAALAAYFSACRANGWPVLLPEGIYRTTDDLPELYDGMHVWGVGVGKTIIRFQPTLTGGTALHIGRRGDNPATTYKVGVHHLTIDCDNSSTRQRTAITVRDVSECTIEHVSINFSPAGDMSGSVGISYQGRDHARVHSLTIGADYCIKFEVNPNAAIGGVLDSDAATWSDLYLTCTRRAGEGGRCIWIADGWSNGPTTFNGGQAWVQGDYGLYWADTSSRLTGQDLILDLGRYEGGTSAAGWAIYINKHGSAQGINRVDIRNFTAAPPDNISRLQSGIYLRKVSALLTNCRYNGSGTALDIDETCGTLVEHGCDWYQLGGSGVNLNGTMRKIFSIGNDAHTKQGERFTVYGPVSDATQYVDVFGQRILATSATAPSASEGVSGDIRFSGDPTKPLMWVKDGSNWYKVPGHYFDGAVLWTTDLTAVAAGATVTKTVASVQCALFDLVNVSWSPEPPDGIIAQAFVTGTNAIKLTVTNLTGAPIAWSNEVSVYLRAQRSNVT